MVMCIGKLAKDGSDCTQSAMEGSEYCSGHDPTMQKERRIAWVEATKKDKAKRASRLTDERKKHILSVPEVRRSAFVSAYQKKSMRSAINAFCLECIQFEMLEITNCTARTCPLYEYRPYQNGEE